MTARDQPPPPAALKLRARDPDDMQAIAVCLQDALIPLGDTAFLKTEKRFVMVANRFRWETASGDAPGSGESRSHEAGDGGDARFEDEDKDSDSRALYERVNCGLCFDGVLKVKFRGLDARDRNQILNLLTLTCDPGAITFVFSGGAEIRLEVERISCHLDDLSEPWPTRWRPAHDAGGIETTDSV